MPTSEGPKQLSIYIAQSRQAQEPIERLTTLAKKRDRSVNYLVVQAILEFLDREERNQA